MFSFAAKLYNRIIKPAVKRSPLFIAGLVFALLCFIGINAAMEPVSKSTYCGTACHEMNISYQTSSPYSLS